MHTHNKRKRKAPIPDNFIDYLTIDQEVALGPLRGCGWELKFIRRRPTDDCTAVLIHTSSHVLSVLEKDGHVNFAPDQSMRRHR
jgi:hypothetical protein